MKKVALIDFCGTVVDFQTLNPYLESMVKAKSRWKYVCFCNAPVKLVCRVISKIGRRFFRVKFLYKAGLVRLLKGVREEDFVRMGELYYQSRVKPNLIPETLDVLQKLKDNSCILVVVSGGSRYYITYFAHEYGIEHCLTAEIEFENGVCTGKIIRECMLSEKVGVINRFVADYAPDHVFEAGISDSRTDMPMLALCKKKIVISHKEHQQWVTDDMDEIIYK